MGNFNFSGIPDVVGGLQSLTDSINNIRASIDASIQGVKDSALASMDGIAKSTGEKILTDYGDVCASLQGLGADMVQVSGAGDSAISQMTRTVVDLATNMQDALAGVAIAICVAFFIISMLELAMSERMTIELWVKYWAKLVVGVAAVYFCGEITGKIYEFGIALGELVAVSAGSSADMTATMENVGTWYATAGEGGLNWLMAFVEYHLMMAPIKLILLVLKGVIYVVGFSRVIELGVRTAFMPIGMALLSDDGWKGAGGHYIKKYISICAQCAVMVMIGNIASWLITQALAIGTAAVAGNGPASIGGTVVVAACACVACIMALFKSIQITNDVFGA